VVRIRGESDDEARSLRRNSTCPANLSIIMLFICIGYSVFAILAYISDLFSVTYLKGFRYCSNVYIFSFHFLKSLPESIEQLRNIRQLVIMGCPEGPELVQSEENKMKFAHINEIILDGDRVHCDVEGTKTRVNFTGVRPVGPQ